MVGRPRSCGYSRQAGGAAGYRDPPSTSAGGGVRLWGTDPARYNNAAPGLSAGKLGASSVVDRFAVLVVLLISAIPFHEAHPTRAIDHAKYTKFRTDPSHGLSRWMSAACRIFIAASH